MVKFFRKTGRKTNRKGAKKSIGKKVVRSTFRQKVLSVIQRSSEKKRISYSNTSSPLTVGQMNGLNTEGYFCLDLSPTPAGGNGSSNRIGTEISLVSANLRMQFYQMSATYQPVRLKYMVVQVKGGDQAITQGDFMTRMFNTNPFNGMRDYNSARNAEYFTAFRVLRTGYCYLPTDPASVSTQTIIKETRLGMKFKKPLSIKFNPGVNSIAQGKIFLCILADSGNINATTASTVNVPVKEVNTGVNFNYVMDYYYTDL